MAESTQYIAKQDMLWSTIAYMAYGKASMMKPIIEANPHVPIAPRLGAGTVLTIPIIDDVLVKTDKELLPPWKR